MAKKIITVFGATGNQGASVVNTFLGDSKVNSDWSVRGVTRDVSSDRAKALATKGVEVVAVSCLRPASQIIGSVSLLTIWAIQADVGDKASLVKAMTGASAVFAMTNYWDKADMELEIQQGKNLADAAKVCDYSSSSLIQYIEVVG